MKTAEIASIVEAAETDGLLSPEMEFGTAFRAAENGGGRLLKNL